MTAPPARGGAVARRRPPSRLARAIGPAQRNHAPHALRFGQDLRLTGGRGRPVGFRRVALRDLASLVFLLLPGELGRPLVDRDVRAEELEQQRQQFCVGLGPQPLGFGLTQQLGHPGIVERGDLPFGGQAGPAQFVPLVLGVAEEHGASVAPVAADHPRPFVFSAAAGDRAAQVLQGGPVIPEPEDLHSPRLVDLDVVGGQQLVVELGPWDLQGEPALGHGRGEQRVRAVVASRVPAWPVLPELSVLPDRDDPGRDQRFHLGQRQDGVALGVGAAIGDVHSPEARQLFEQQ